MTGPNHDKTGTADAPSAYVFNADKMSAFRRARLATPPRLSWLR